MLKKLLSYFILILFLSIGISARAKYSDYVQVGGKSVKTSTLTTYLLMETYPNSTVTIYLAGTTTLATIYSNNSGTIKLNPFTADSKAYYEFYADNGFYDIKFSGTGIISPFTKAYIALSDPTDTYNPISFGAKCDNSTNDTVAFSAIISLIGSIKATINIPKLGPCRINTTSFPVNITLNFDSSGGLYSNTGQIITIIGPIHAEPIPIFYNALDTQGTVTFPQNTSLVREVYPEWWGGIPSASTSIQRRAVQKAVDSGKPVKLIGVYIVDDTILLNNSTFLRTTISGLGFKTSYIITTNTSTCGIKINYGPSGTPTVVLKDFALRGTGGSFTSGNYGICVIGGNATSITQLIVDDLAIDLFNDDGINLKGPTGPIQIRDTHITDTRNWGIKITFDSNNISPQNVTISGGAIQGYILGGISADAGGSSSISGLNISTVDIELQEEQTKPGIYFNSVLGANVIGITVASINSTLATLGDANVYIDSGSSGNTFIGGINAAHGGLNNIHDVGPNHGNTFIGGLYSNNATPSGGLSYYAEVTSSVRDLFFNPVYNIATFAADHNMVHDNAGKLVMAFGARVATHDLGVDQVLVAPDIYTDFTQTALLTQMEGTTLSISSNIIAPTNNVHLVGTGLIKNISVPGGFIGGAIYLFTGATPFTMDATGNVAVPVTTPAANSMVMCVERPSSLKWYCK